MPNPAKGESKQKYLRRCTKELIDKEGKKADQAYAVCNSMWEDKHGLALSDSRTLVTLAEASQIAVDQEQNTFLMTCYTGRPVDRWWGKLVIDISGVSVKQAIPALRGHDQDAIVGMINKTWEENNRFYATGTFSSVTGAAKEVKGLADELFPWQCSMGIRALQVLELKDETQSLEVNGMSCKGPMEVWTKSKLLECSFLPFGADDASAAVSMGGDEDEDVEYIEFTETTKGVTSMLDLATLSDILKTVKLKDKAALEAFLTAHGLDESQRDAFVTVLMLLERFQCEKFTGIFSALAHSFPELHYAVKEVDLESKESLQSTLVELAATKAKVAELQTQISATAASTEANEHAAWLAGVQTKLTALCLPGIDKDAIRVQFEQSGKEDVERLLVGFAAVDTAARASGAFNEAGNALGTSEPEPKGVQLEKLVAEKVAAGVKVAAAWRQVIMENAELYSEYAASITTRVGS